MTRRLFHEDPRLVRFEAEVVEAGLRDGRPVVILDQTAFYPESGGQPWDTGRLAGARIAGVVEEAPWGRILHFLDDGTPLPAAGAHVEGEVDWARRFDHMQQHTGQHLLTRAIERLHGVPTVSFHLGEREVTIDLETPSLPSEALDEAEDLLASVLREARPIVPRWVAPEEVPEGIALPEEARSLGRVRLVEVAGFDLDPCCGTHCGRTAEVGAIVILGQEKAGKRTRVSFLCGERARAETRRRLRWTTALARRLSMDPSDLPAGLDRMLEEARALRKERTELRVRLAEREASSIEPVPGDRFDLVCLDLGERLSEEAQALAAAFRPRPRTVVLVGWKDGSGARILATRSADLDLDVRPAIAEAAPLLGGRGGGGPDNAQCGGPDTSRLPDALAAARQRLES